MTFLCGAQYSWSPSFRAPLLAGWLGKFHVPQGCAEHCWLLDQPFWGLRPPR